MLVDLCACEAEGLEELLGGAHALLRQLGIVQPRLKQSSERDSKGQRLVPEAHAGAVIRDPSSFKGLPRRFRICFRWFQRRNPGFEGEKALNDRGSGRIPACPT